jgi:hypothetical protein
LDEFSKNQTAAVVKEGMKEDISVDSHHHFENSERVVGEASFAAVVVVVEDGKNDDEKVEYGKDDGDGKGEKEM